MNEIEDAKKLLKENSLHVCDRTSLVICYDQGTCGIGFKLDRDRLRGHIKTFHEARKGISRNLFDAAKKVAGTRIDSSLLSKYQSGGSVHGVLPRLHGLPTLKGRMCVGCEMIFVNDETLRTHIARNHSIKKKNAAEIAKLPVVLCQSLGKKTSGLRPFLVADAVEEEDDADVVKAYDPGAVIDDAHSDVEDWYKSPFVSLAKVSQRFEESGLNMDKIHLLLGGTSPWNDDQFKQRMRFVKSIIRDQLDEAKELSKHCGEFYNFLSVIQTSGCETKNISFQFLTVNKEGEAARRQGLVPRDTLQKYVDHISVVVRIACLTAKHRSELDSVFIAPKIEMYANEIMDKDPAMDPNAFAKSIFNLQWEIFKEKKTSGGRGAASEIFSFVVCACLCVHHDKHGRPQMSNGATVRSRLTGILYGASCFFALYLLKYNEGSDWEKAMKEVSDITNPSSQHAISFMTDLRTICRHLQDEEVKLNPFQRCERHYMCGLYHGKEFSAKQYGDRVREMQSTIRASLRSLLNTEQLPGWFESGAESLVDDVDKDVVGYWALADERNREFVERCSNWAQKAANLTSLEAFGWKAWKNNAENVYMILLTAMHITGGGPARGTEIGSMLTRNTMSSRRNMYFLKNEVMLLPLYSKTRHLKRGNLVKLTRHVDIVTSNLFREFFLLLHPVMVMMEEATSKGPDGRKSLLKLRDRINLGRWSPRIFAEEIGRKMNAFKIPFKYSEFRQHQRGLAQGKRGFSLLRVLVDAVDATAGSAIDGGTEEEKAAIEQGGHTIESAEKFYAHIAKLGNVSVHGEQNKIEVFRKASQEWHIDLGLRTNKEQTSSKFSRPERVLLAKNADGMLGECKRSEQNALSRVDPKDMRSQVVAELLANNPSLTEILATRTPSQILSCLRSGETTVTDAESVPGPNVSGCSRQEISRVKAVALGHLEAPLMKDVSDECAKLQERVEESLEQSLKSPLRHENAACVKGSTVSATVPEISPETVRSGNVASRQEIGGAPLRDGKSGGRASWGRLVFPTERKDDSTVGAGTSAIPAQTFRQENGNTEDETISAMGSPLPSTENLSGMMHSAEVKMSSGQNVDDKMVASDTQAEQEEIKHAQNDPNSQHAREHEPPPCTTRQKGGRSMEERPEDLPVQSGKKHNKSLGRVWERFRSGASRTSLQSSRKRLENGDVTHDEGCSLKNSKDGSSKLQILPQEAEKRKGPTILREQKAMKKARKQTKSQHNASKISACGGTGSPSLLKPKNGNEIIWSPEENRGSRHNTDLDDRMDEVTEGGTKSLSEILGETSFAKPPVMECVDAEPIIFHTKIIGRAFNALDALRKVTKPGAEFKSESQRLAMEAVALRRGDLLLVLGTGEGKTAVVMGPATKEAGVTVWVCPLRALRWETERRMKRGGLEVFSLETIKIARAGAGVGMVLLVSPEDMAKPALRECMKQLTARNALNRLVIDEAHLAAMAESYRPCFTLLKSVTMYGTLCPVVMLTATAPPSMERRVTKICGSNSMGVEIHRGDPCRRNLCLRVIYLRDAQEATLMNEIFRTVSILKQLSVGKSARCLIVCLTVDDSKTIHRELVDLGLFDAKDVLLYHSQRDEITRGNVMKSWQASLKSGVRIVVATEGFSTGTDASNVRLVIFAGASRNLVDYWQGAGRAGRDGNSADVIVLYHNAHLFRGQGGKNDSKKSHVERESGDFGEWARNRTVCRRARIETFLTGTSSVESCITRNATGFAVSPCDICLMAKPAEGYMQKEGTVLRSSATGKEEKGRCVKTPSDAELTLSRVQQSNRARFVDKERAWLRRVGLRLNSYCAEHLLHLYGIRTSIEFCSRSSKDAWEESRKCPGTCSSANHRCLRCTEIGHRAGGCKTFSSISIDWKTGLRSGDGRCRHCRLLSVHGQDPHAVGEFGQTNCPLTRCLFLALRAWDRFHIQRDMKDKRRGITWGEKGAPSTRKEFAVWLTEENSDKDAGISSALRWITRRLPEDIGR